MDRSSMKPKPIPPPKPSARFSSQHALESCEKERKAAGRISGDSSTLSNDHIYNEIGLGDNNNDGRLPLLKNKTGEEEDWNASAIKSQTVVSVPSVILSPKPPLLPKPNTSVTKHLPLQPKSPALRPTLPRRSDQRQKEEHSPQDVSITSCKPVNSKRSSGLAPLSLKAPVAILDEFDSWYEKKTTVTSPVRPPRSPKTKSFVEGPFEKLDIKPELPVKKRWLLAGNGGRKNWENAKKRSLSLGRSENAGFLQDGNKSRSLGRNLSLNEHLATCIDARIGPIPPPRRRNKSEEIPRLIEMFDSGVDKKSQVPVYAAVNYEMKKNRRKKAEQVLVLSSQPETGTDEEVFVNEVDVIVEGSLLLGHIDSEKDGNYNAQAETEHNLHVGEAVNDTAVNNVQAEMEHNVHIGEAISDTVVNQCSSLLTDTNGPISEAKISQPLTLDNQVPLNVVDRLENQSTSQVNVCKVEDVQCSSNNCDEGFSKSSERISKVDPECAEKFLSPISSHLHPSVEVNSNIRINEHLKLDHDHSEDHISHLQTNSEVWLPNPTANSEVLVPGLKANSSELHRLMSDDDISSQSQSAFKSSDGAVEKETCDTVNNELVLNSMENLESSTIFVDKSKDLQLHENSNTNRDCTKCDIENLNERPVSTCEQSNMSDLVIIEKMVETMSEDVLTTSSTPKQNMKPLWRRQSWSSSKDTTPSPERGPSSSVGKNRHQMQQPWCDEGDLSNGALADSDTGSSDNTARLSQEDVHSVRSKISAWFEFGSMGKGGKKRNKERKARTSSQFYSEDENIQPDLRPAPSVPIGNVSLGHSVISTTSKGEEDSESDNEDQQGNIIDNLTEHQRQERKVFFIAQELMTSEKEFVDVLKLLNVHFSEAVNAGGNAHNPVIPKSEFLKIINSLPQLQRLNEDLLRDLENRIENWSRLPKIADVIVKKGPFLKLYSSYIQNFESQCNLLDECCQRYPRFAKVVKEFEASPCCRKLNVKHFMLKPVQRIPQYRLLLEDYLRHLDIASPDFQDTEEALRIVRDVADHANRSVKLGDHLSKLIELQSQLSNYEIIKPGRQFVKDGELFKLSRKGKHPRFFILLNDCLLYTSKSNTSLIRVNNELPLNGMKVNRPQVEDYRCEFSIISVTRSFTLAASSTEERADWINALQNTIKEHTERQLTFQLVPKSPLVLESSKLGQQAPVWIQDSRVTMCQSCTTQFTVMFRRHHCRACGKVVCGVCSDNRAPLRYMRFHAARVCEECHDVLLQEFEDPRTNMLQIIMNETGQMDPKETLESMRSLFKKSTAGGKKKVMLQKKDIPQRLKEVAANDSGSQMSGWLQRRGRRSWKRLWFVLKEQVLYVYKASEDVVALESIPVLGYKVEPMTERHFQIYEGIDARLVFQLAHSGQLPLVFHADTEHMANRWMQAMQEATVLM